MQKTKRQPGIIAKFQNAIKESQKEIDKQIFDSDEVRSESVSIGLNNGYWQINQKPLSQCSIAKQSLFDQFLRMKLVKLPITQESSFKDRSEEVKKKHNYTFKIKEQNWLGEYPNLEKLSFEPKN